MITLAGALWQAHDLMSLKKLHECKSMPETCIIAQESFVTVAHVLRNEGFSTLLLSLDLHCVQPCCTVLLARSRLLLSWFVPVYSALSTSLPSI